LRVDLPPNCIRIGIAIHSHASDLCRENWFLTLLKVQDLVTYQSHQFRSQTTHVFGAPSGLRHTTPLCYSSAEIVFMHET
jgi:hypothetical protein